MRYFEDSEVLSFSGAVSVAVLVARLLERDRDVRIGSRSRSD